MVLSETRRRLLAHLSEPRSVPNLTRVLRADQFAPFDASQAFTDVAEQVDAELADCLKEGLVAKVGAHSEAKSALRAVAENGDAIDLPKVKAEALRSRLESGRDSRLDTGELFILSKNGLDALTA